MKRFLFAVAAVALVASVGSAQETPVVAPPATATPVIVGAPSAPVIEYGPTTTTARRGLFGRFRGRGTTAPTIVGSPVPMTTTVPGTITAPPPVATPSVPMPMPMPMPGSSSMTTNGTIVLTSGTMSSSDMLMPAGGMMTATTSEPAQRRGLFGRRSR